MKPIQFCTEPEYFQEHEDLPLSDLDRLLRNFIVILKKPEQTEYKPSTVKGFTSKYTIPDPGYQWESNKLKLDITNGSQEVSHFQGGDHKATIHKRARIANTTEITGMIHKRSTGTVSKNLTLSSDVDQDT